MPHLELPQDDKGDDNVEKHPILREWYTKNDTNSRTPEMLLPAGH